MKDNFSEQSSAYARYRPGYPQALFDYVIAHLPNRQFAWDCGTGNGQVSGQIFHFFDKIYATDISSGQLKNAIQNSKIEYSQQAAEKTNFPNHFFDLIIVAQAIHWFDFEAFYHEVRRVMKPDGLLVVIGYGLVQISPEIDAILFDFYHNTIGKYWDNERKYIDEDYTTIPFPFDEVKTPRFENIFHWEFEHFMGYLGTWSAVKHYERATGKNPLNQLHWPLHNAWGQGVVREVRFPILLRIGKLIQ